MKSDRPIAKKARKLAEDAVKMVGEVRKEGAISGELYRHAQASALGFMRISAMLNGQPDPVDSIKHEDKEKFFAEPEGDDIALRRTIAESVRSRSDDRRREDGDSNPFIVWNTP